MAGKKIRRPWVFLGLAVCNSSILAQTPVIGGGSGTGNVSTTSAATFVAGAKVTVQPNATTAGLNVACAILPSAPASGDFAVDSGAGCQAKVWNGTAWQLATSPISTVFGRTGTVVATTADYTAAQVTNAVDKTIANAYTAGIKSTFQSSATTAPFRIVPTANPSTPVAGDCNITVAGVLNCWDGSQWLVAISPISTVFGRTGAVVATSGDYNASQVTNAADKTAANVFSSGLKQTVTPSSTTAGLRIVPLAGIPSSLVEGDLHYNDTTNRFGYYNGAGMAEVANSNSPNTYTFRNSFTSGANGGLDAGFRLIPTDLPTAPVAGDCAVDSNATNLLKCFDGTTWLAAVGAQQFSELLDFKHTVTSTTTLTITAGLFGIGNYSFPGSIGGAVTFSGSSSGDAKVFLDEDGALITEATTGITFAADTGQMTHRNAATPAFPDTAIPICDLTVNAGTYTIDQCGMATRVRRTVYKAGSGLLAAPAVNGKITLSTDPAAVHMVGATSISIPYNFPVGGYNGTTIAAGAGWEVPTTGGPTLTASGTTFTWIYLQYANTADSQADFKYKLPPNWNGGVISARWGWRTGSGATIGHIFDMRVSTACVANDEVFNVAPTFNAEQFDGSGLTGLTVTTAEDLMFATASSLTLTGCAANELLIIRHRREIDDTLTTNAHLFNIELLVGLSQ